MRWGHQAGTVASLLPKSDHKRNGKNVDAAFKNMAESLSRLNAASHRESNDPKQTAEKADKLTGSY